MLGVVVFGGGLFWIVGVFYFVGGVLLCGGECLVVVYLFGEGGGE